MIFKFFIILLFQYDLDTAQPQADQDVFNVDRLSHLVRVCGTEILRSEFDNIVPPEELPEKLEKGKCKIDAMRGVFTKDMKSQLYPPKNTYGESKNFDITLLVALMRNICGLEPPPSTGSWDRQPDDSDDSLQADIYRIKSFRNQYVAHPSTTPLSKQKFDDQWIEISKVLIRRGGVKMENRIEQLRRLKHIDKELSLQAFNKRFESFKKG